MISLHSCSKCLIAPAFFSATRMRLSLETIYASGAAKAGPSYFLENPQNLMGAKIVFKK